MSSMGAGAKADPSRVQISDISDTFGSVNTFASCLDNWSAAIYNTGWTCRTLIHNVNIIFSHSAEDPLARAVRRRLKKLGIDAGIDVVFSSEKPYYAKPQPNNGTSKHQDQGRYSDDDEENQRYAPLPNFHSATSLPVFGPLPAMFGMSMATFITCKIAGWSAMEPLLVKNRAELYQRLHRDLKIQEEELAASQGKTVTDIPLDRRDVGYVIEEMFRGGKSGISQSMDKIAVCRWKREEPLSLTNVVVLTQKEMERHLALPLGVDLEAKYGKKVVAFVEGLFKEEEQICRLR